LPVPGSPSWSSFGSKSVWADRRIACYPQWTILAGIFPTIAFVEVLPPILQRSMVGVAALAWLPVALIFWPV
jgi:hypothetical protein